MRRLAQIVLAPCAQHCVYSTCGPWAIVLAVGEAQHRRARLVPLIPPVSRRGRAHVNVDHRSFGGSVCVRRGQRSNAAMGHERRMRARSAWLGREVICVGNDWAAAPRTSGMGYSEYSQGALGVLTGGTLSAHTGYSECSQGVLGVLTAGARSAHRGYSEYSQGVLRVLTGGTHGGASAAARPSGTRQAEPKPRRWGGPPAAHRATLNRAYPPARARCRSSQSALAHAHAHGCVRPIARPTHALFVYHHNKHMTIVAFVRTRVADAHA
jgi:hypothetical protein